MDEEGEGFEEWDADFLDQVIRVEESALSTPSPAAAAAITTFLPPPSSSSYLPPQPPPSQPQQSRLFVPPPHTNTNAVSSISYSPPRELSQRTVNRSNTSDHYCPPPNPAQTASTSSYIATTAHSDSRDKELEIQRLKRELDRVSKQLTSQELECTELRKERDKKEEQLKSIFSQTEGKRSGDCNLKGITGDSREREPVKSDANIQRNIAVEYTCKGVGVQTDKAIDTDQLARQNLARKLQAIWMPPFNCKVRSSLVSKLFVGYHALLRSVDGDISSKTKSDLMADGTSCNPDALKVSRFYSVIVKVSDGTEPLEGLLEPLVSLCGCENVTILHKSLGMLHLILQQLFSTVRNFEKSLFNMVKGTQFLYFILKLREFIKESVVSIFSCPLSRDNVIITELPKENVAGVHGSATVKMEAPHVMDFREASGFSSTVSFIEWISLFELFHYIIMKNKEEPLRLEAISIMNLILLGNAYEEREKFGLPIVLESISELLKKGNRSPVQKQAVQLLFLLLNCPKLLEAFCSLDGGNSSSVDDNATTINFQGSAIVLEGLAGCLACCGNDIEDLELRRRVIVLLAFLGSSGNAGFQIVMNHKLENGANFLMLILQALVLELDVEAAGRCESPEISKQRTLLMREALIFLNRLVSNPLYSSTSLRLLTNSRDMVSLSIDVANRMSKKPHINISRQQGRDAEIIELACAFKRKVFAYLGDGIS